MRRIDALEADTRWPESTVCLEVYCPEMFETCSLRLWERQGRVTIEIAPDAPKIRAVEYELVATARDPSGKGILPALERVWDPAVRAWIRATFDVPSAPYVTEALRDRRGARAARGFASGLRSLTHIPISTLDREQVKRLAEEFANEWRSWEEPREALRRIRARARQVNSDHALAVLDGLRDAEVL